MRIIVGVTGASGALFAVDFLKRLKGIDTSLIVSKWGRYVLREEAGLSESDLSKSVTRTFLNEDLAAPCSSGSNPFDAVVILPCSVSTLAKIANGIGDTLITRTANVALKEHRRLILVVRESPMSTIHLEQAHKVSQAGAIVMPLSPLFYHHPRTIDDMTEQFSGKLLSLLGAGDAQPWRPEEFEAPSSV